MKKMFKIGCGVVVAIIILIIIIATFSGDDSTDNETNNTNNTETTNNNDNGKEEDTDKEVGVGTPLEIGGAVFTVNEVSTASQVGPSVLPDVATGLYLVLDVTYKNNGNEAVTIDSSFFKLVRGDKTYEADSSASMSANQGEDGSIQNSFFLQEVNPDMEISGKVVFDLAKEVAEADDLQLQVQTGFWGTETGTINLK